MAQRTEQAHVAMDIPRLSLVSLATTSLIPSHHLVNHAISPSSDTVGQTTIDSAIINEDVAWHGAITVTGSVVVAPLATLRIEPGTTVRFIASSQQRDLPRLVVQGRLLCLGKPEQPVVLSADSAHSGRGRWGGLIFVSTEKRNQLEYCRIEGAETGINVLYSTVAVKDVDIQHSQIGINTQDAVVQAGNLSISDCDSGIIANDSELELRTASVSGSRRGIVARKTAIGILSGKISENEQVGLQADDCRIKMTSSTISGNGHGAEIKGGEGQILSSRFSDNRDSALQLVYTRMKVNRTWFTGNIRDAVRVEGGKSLITGCSFVANSGYNLYNAGQESVIALQNWWGQKDSAIISQKIFDVSRDQRSGAVLIYPWLMEKPQQVQ